MQHKSAASPLLNNGEEVELFIEQNEDDIQTPMTLTRPNSAGNRPDVSPILTTGWFDTKEEYEKHKKDVKNKLRQSYNQSPDARNTWRSYKKMGGMAGSMIIGGPDAFDVSSNGALEDLKKSAR